LDSLENKIVLNSYELEIKEATITAVETKTQTTLKAQNISYDEAGRNATLDFGQSIKHDNRKSILSMKFNGILNNTMSGFYRSAYTDANGEKKYMFSSQCEVHLFNLVLTIGL
jgi:aminopeptidase N